MFKAFVEASLLFKERAFVWRVGSGETVRGSERYIMRSPTQGWGLSVKTILFLSTAVPFMPYALVKTLLLRRRKVLKDRDSPRAHGRRQRRSCQITRHSCAAENRKQAAGGAEQHGKQRAVEGEEQARHRSSE